MTSHYQHRAPNVKQLSRVILELDESDWHEHETETIFAARMSENVYRLRNVPFYAYGLSYGDVVVAEALNEECLFRRVYERGGHSTYRIFLTSAESKHQFEQAWKTLGNIGCFFERATDCIVAADIPPETDIYEVYAALEEGQAEGVWDFEEGYCAHL